MTNIAIFAASDLEYNSVKAILTNWQTKDYGQNFLAGKGQAGDNQIELFCTKMGPQNAAEQANKALDQTKANIVLIVGLAGGLVANSQHTDLVLYENCFFLPNYELPLSPSISCDEKLNKILYKNLQTKELNLFQGSGITLPWVVCKAQEKANLAQKYKVFAVDMESYQILKAAKQRDRVATVLRIISDDAKGDLPNINNAMDKNAEVNNFKMLVEFAKHPVLATRFLLNLNKAIKVLKNTLPKILSQDFGSLSC
jgi:nucleoside phosphorylase